ncbi:hypothetical protein Tco_0503913 [Tanacetum coccineum]
MVEPSRTKKLKNFDFITEDGTHIHLTEEEINHQKKLKEDAKAKAAKQEGEVRKAKLVDMLSPKVVKKYYNDKLQYDNYCDKMLKRRAISRITNCTRMDYIHTTKAELGINLDIPLSKQCPLDKLNDLEKKKRKHVDDIHDYFKANKRLKPSVQYKDHLPGTVLNEPVLASVTEVPSASALQVLRRLGSIFTSVYAAVQKLKKGSWLELQFSLADNFKLNVFKFEGDTTPNFHPTTLLFRKQAGQRKPKGQWTGDERKAANLDQRLKSLIISVLLDDQIKSVINCLTAKSAWDDLILYHEGPSDVKESKVMDLKLCYSTFKFKEAKYNKVKAKLALLSFSASFPKSSFGKNKGLIAETYKWDEEEVSPDENEAIEVKALMALANEERVYVSKESDINGE